jgi:DNA-binding transcriptional MerR regulator
MSVHYRKYTDQVIILLISVILILLFILMTDMHLAKINREMRQTTHQSF